jgi:benzylsuccinate CoA-transferase BbsF subunit
MMNNLPLNGIRVVDLSWIIAGPTATRFLATMGAEVIKVGSARRPDPSTGSPPFQAYNQSKSYCSLNISDPKGLELVKQLLAISDVVIENFAVGVIERLGLSYEVVSAQRPDIIMVSSSGTGHTGPDKDYVAYGSLLQHYTGWNSISGNPQGEPVPGGLWADPWVGMELAMVTAAALNNRALTGQGQYVDFSMAESLSAGIPGAILDYQMNDRVPELMGNRDELYAPHGVYHCVGADRWVAIAITNDDEWRLLCGVIQRPDLAEDSRFAGSDGRMKHRDALDSAISQWTMRFEDYEAMRLLQQAGVPSGPSLDISRVFNESQLREGGYLKTIQMRDGEARDLPGLPWRFDGGQEPIFTEAPVLGQHNAYVFQELLGLTEREATRLVEEQVIY